MSESTEPLPDEGASRVVNTVNATSVGVAAQVGVVHGGLHLHTPSDVVVPRQLPLPPRPFAGRGDELAALDRLLGVAAGEDATREAPALAVIGGVGGIGKTWLALHWAHRRATRFPDGHLFVDLRGFSPEADPVSPATALRGFLLALTGRPDAVPDDTDTRAALFRSITADRKVLIVLDNARDAAQVVPLLPGGAGCAVLVTSRRVLGSLVGRHGAHLMGLDVLSDSEAHSLLVHKVGGARVAAEPYAVRDLIRSCKGFSLSLGVIAARAHVHANIPLAEFAAELRDEGIDALADDDPAADLSAVLSWSYRVLTAEQKRTFALLGIAPGPDIALPAAASLTGLSASAAGRALRSLTEASLLNRQPDGRYSMHDLVRGYSALTARRELTEDVRRAALSRSVDHYLHTALTADRVLYPHREQPRLDPPTPGVRPQPMGDAAAALAWFVTERSNLLAAQHTAARLDRHHAVWQLAWAHATFHAWRGHAEDRLALWRAAVAAAEELSEPAVLALALRHLGRAHARLGRHDEAVTHLSRALVASRRLDDPVHEAHVHYQLARTLGRAGHLARALEHATRARRLYRGIDRPIWEADALNEMAKLKLALGDHDRARDDCLTALATHGRHGNRGGEAAVREVLGHIDHTTGDHHAAIRHYQRALALHRDHGSTSEAATTLDHLGRAHAALGRHRQARAAWEEAAAHYREQGLRGEALDIQERLDALGGHT
ncbi:tetratricopeptide repeat protein [Actinosynnema sp. NPDC004786]